MVALVVDDYDPALDYYTRTMGFTCLEDTDLGGGKRWVVVAPDPEDGAALLLARATTDEQRRCVGRQTGGRVFLFLYTDDFTSTLARLRAAGVDVTEEPRHEGYGTVVVLRDRYGNLWDLIERRHVSHGPSLG